MMIVLDEPVTIMVVKHKRYVVTILQFMHLNSPPYLRHIIQAHAGSHDLLWSKLPVVFGQGLGSQTDQTSQPDTGRFKLSGLGSQIK